MTLNSFFDHIYCINLDSRPDKWELCEEEFQRIGLKNVERFPAFDGKNNKVSTALLPGEAGILLSNQDVLYDAKARGFERILILEDDIQFSPNFVADWNSWSGEVPQDWEMLYLGGNLVGWHPSPVSDHVHNGEHIFAIHALGLHQNTFEHMLNAIDINTQIDVIYANESIHFKSYLMIPRMAWQRPGVSDIQNEYVDYSFLHSHQWGINS